MRGGEILQTRIHDLAVSAQHAKVIRGGVILSMKHEVRVMQGQGSGSIINISSTYGHEGAAGASVYIGTKHAVEGITKSVALR